MPKTLALLSYHLESSRATEPSTCIQTRSGIFRLELLLLDGEWLLKSTKLIVGEDTSSADCTDWSLYPSWVILVNTILIPILSGIYERLLKKQRGSPIVVALTCCKSVAD